MKIDCISDLHGYYPKLEGGDLLIVCGDLTARDSPIEYGHFAAWIDRQKYNKKVLVAGNHDTFFQNAGSNSIQDTYSDINVEYLCDSGTEFEGLKIWGSPWTAQFPGINPKCCAFTVNFGCDTEYWLDEYWKLIPDDTDILITHSPPHGVLDKCLNGNVGSKTLLEAIERIKPKLHIFGHIHECGGSKLLYKHEGPNTWCVNASIVNERYEHVNKPIRIEL